MHTHSRLYMLRIIEHRSALDTSDFSGWFSISCYVFNQSSMNTIAF